MSAIAQQNWSDFMVDLGSDLAAEILLTVLFCSGFALFRLSSVQRIFKLSCFGPFGKPGDKNLKAKTATFRRPSLPTFSVAKQFEANLAAGRADLVIAEWPTVDRFDVGGLRAVVEAFVSTRRNAEVPAILREIFVKHSYIRTPEALAAVCDAAASDSLVAEVRRAYASSAAAIAHKAAPRREAPAQRPAAGRVGGNSAPVNALVQRIRAAVQTKCPEDAMQAVVAAADAGVAVPPAYLVAVLRVLHEGQTDGCGAAETLVRLPVVLWSQESSAALMNYARAAGDVDLMLGVYTRASELGVTLTLVAREALLRGLAAAGDSRAVETFEALIAREGGGAVLSDAAFASVISACAESRHVHLADSCAEYARRSRGRLNLSQYSSLMKVYGQARLFQKTCDLYEAMRRDAVVPDTVAYGCLIRAAVESGKTGLAQRLFVESGNPDLLNCMSLIRAAGRERDVPKALALLGRLEKSLFGADTTAYNCALEACAACGDRASAERLLKRMEANNSVDVVSYNTYVKVLLAQGATEEAAEVLRNMPERGILPNVVTYNSLIKDSVARQDLEAAWRIVDNMESGEVRPDAFTCSILMKGARHAANAAHIDRILALVRRAKVVPDEVLITCLLEACVKLRDSDRLSHVLEEFKPNGGMLSPHATAMLIRALGHSGQMDRAWVLWAEATSVGRVEKLDEEVFSCMVDACLSSDEISGVATVWRQAKPRLEAFPRAASLLAATVRHHLQRKQPQPAIQLLEEASDAVACTSMTYNAIMDALVREGDMSSATALFRDMTLRGTMPDLITHSTLIKGHCARGELEEALQLLCQMQRRGIMPDLVLFNSMLDGCAHRQMRTLTEQVLRDMEAASVSPSNATISILVKLYGRCNDLDAAFEVVESYPVKYKFKANAQVYTCLMSACIANGKQSMALDVYDNMVARGCLADAKTFRTLLGGCVRHHDAAGAARLVDDALREGPAGRPAAGVDRELAESVLLMMTRQDPRVAPSTLRRFQEVGLRVSERVCSVVRRL